MIVFFARPATCQDTQGTSSRDESTRFDYSKGHGFLRALYPYTAPSLPGPRLDNSQRLQDLIVDGKLTLALDDAIALALENNLEIAVTRVRLTHCPKLLSDVKRLVRVRKPWLYPTKADSW
jgi:hypothetical protein